jgi:hypothetical protein
MNCSRVGRMERSSFGTCVSTAKCALSMYEHSYFRLTDANTTKRDTASHLEEVELWHLVARMG